MGLAENNTIIQINIQTETDRDRDRDRERVWNVSKSMLYAIFYIYKPKNQSRSSIVGFAQISAYQN